MKKLFELKVVLDRLAQTDSTLAEALSHDVEEATRLTDECIAELSAGTEDQELIQPLITPEPADSTQPDS